MCELSNFTDTIDTFYIIALVPLEFVLLIFFAQVCFHFCVCFVSALLIVIVVVAAVDDDDYFVI